MRARSLFPKSYWYWIGLGALLGYTVLFNILFTLFLSYLNRKTSLHYCKLAGVAASSSIFVTQQYQFLTHKLLPHAALGKQQAIVSKEELQEREQRSKGESVAVELREYLQHSGSRVGLLSLLHDLSS